jgi:phosphatidylinositol N-acetylglucosaminyltransferase subunit A
VRGVSSTGDTRPQLSTDRAPAAMPHQHQHHRVALVSDFFYPRLGGVEGHIWSLAQCLLARGHGAVVITGSYWLPDGTRRVGVRHMTGGLRVYYLPLLPVFDQAVFPGYFTGLPLLRAILARERVTLVHGHQTTSVLQHECLLQAQLLGYRTVYTDHSLFGFDDPAALNLSKYLSFPLAAADAAIAVSHTGRANLVARTGLPPERVYAIPNAVDATKFAPAPDRRPPPPAVTVVLLSRLVYRKGIDLAVRVIPAVAAAKPHVRFVVGGDGPKRLLLEEMRERHGLHDRVELLGAVPHAGVRAVLNRGHVFLNCSLTEAFCIAILEAACAGCLVVSTPVGGVPEVLPPGLAILAQAPEAGALTAALLAAIDRVEAARRQGAVGGGGDDGTHDGGAPARQQGAGATPGSGGAGTNDDAGSSSATASNNTARR